MINILLPKQRGGGVSIVSLDGNHADPVGGRNGSFPGDFNGELSGDLETRRERNTKGEGEEVIKETLKRGCNSWDTRRGLF